jgi:hypothetical protein
MEKEFRQKPNDKAQMNKPEKFPSAMEVVAAYAPPFAFLVSLGFGIIYTITVNGFPNIDPPVELLWLAVSAAVAGLIYIPVPWLIKRQKIINILAASGKE